MATVESIVYGALSSLAGGDVFPDVAPSGQAQTGRPWVAYQAVGGQSFATVDSATPTLRNARVQVSVYAHTRKEAAELMEQCFQALANPTVRAVPIGAPVSTFEADTLLYGSSLDFSVTYN
jgi:hypothetical protein